MRGKKSEQHFNWWDPPRRRANKRRGHGTYETDRPPIIGTIGRESGQVRLRVAHTTNSATLLRHVYKFTRPSAQLCTDEWSGYSGVKRQHYIVCHSAGEWARDDDGDGIREVHTNTCEGMWTEVRNFLRPFKGVHKKYLSNYVAISEWRINYKRISHAFICAIVARHSFHT